MPQNNFYVQIPFKGCKVEARFEKGNVAKGINAKLITNDKFTQRALEASEMFGKMYKVVETIAEPEDEQERAAAEQAVAPAPKPAAKGGVKKTTKKDEPTPENTNANISFDSTADAIVYIATNYSGTEVHTKEEAIAFLAEQNITAAIND